MSRATLRQKAGLIFAVVVFALGMTAAVALGWEVEQKPKDYGKKEQNHGKNEEKGKEHGKKNEGKKHDKSEHKGKEHGKNEHKGKEHGKNEGKGQEGKEKPPTVTTPETPASPVGPTGETPAPVGPTGPAAPLAPTPVPSQAPSPVGSQGAPEQPSEQGGEENKGGQENQGGQGQELAQNAPSESAPLAPVAEQRQLARTGLNPALIALLGALCLGGGAFLFRRGLAR